MEPSLYAIPSIRPTSRSSSREPDDLNPLGPETSARPAGLQTWQPDRRGKWGTDNRVGVAGDTLEFVGDNTGIQWREAASSALPYADASFDAVLAEYVLSTTDRQAALIGRLRYLALLAIRDEATT